MVKRDKPYWSEVEGSQERWLISEGLVNGEESSSGSRSPALGHNKNVPVHLPRLFWASAV